MINLFAFIVISVEYLYCDNINTSVKNERSISSVNNSYDSNSSTLITGQHKSNEQLSAVGLLNDEKNNEKQNNGIMDFVDFLSRCSKLIEHTNFFAEHLHFELLFNLRCWSKKSKGKIGIINDILKAVVEYKPQVIKISNYIHMQNFLYYRNNIFTYLFDRENDKIIKFLIELIEGKQLSDDLIKLIETSLNTLTTLNVLTANTNELTYVSMYYTDVKEEEKSYVLDLMKIMINKFDIIIKNYDKNHNKDMNNTDLIDDIKEFIAYYFALKYKIISLLNIRSYIAKQNKSNDTQFFSNTKFSDVLELLIKYIYYIIGDNDDFKKLLSLVLELNLFENDKFLHFKELYSSYPYSLKKIVDKYMLCNTIEYQKFLDVISHILECHSALKKLLMVEKCNIPSRNLKKTINNYLKDHYNQLKDIESLIKALLYK